MDGSTLLSATVGGCVLGGGVGFLFAGIAWRNRDVPVALPYGLLSLAFGAWGVAAAAVLLVDAPALATALSGSAHVFAAAVPPLWFWFAATYTGAGRLQDRRVLAGVALVPAAYALLRASAPFHGMVPYRVTFVTDAGITAPVDPAGAAFWAFVAYDYLVVVAGFLLFAWFLARSRNAYRVQTGLIVLGSLVPVVGNLAVLSGVLPHPALEITPAAFGAGGLFVGVALWRYGFMDVTPVANDALVDELPDPVLVLDGNGMIAEHNEAALTALGRESLIGTRAALIHPALSGETGASRIRLGNDDRVFDLRVTSLGDRHGIVGGRLVVLRDVTVQQRRLDRIEALQVLSRQLIEATSREGIGEAAVSFLESELDASFAVVYADGDGALHPVAASETADERGLVVESDDDHPLAPYASADEPQLVDPDVLGDDDDPVIAVPLGSVGLLCLGLERRSLPDEDEQSVRILRGTLTAALSRVEREQQLGQSRREVDRRTEQIEFFTGVLQHNIRNGMQVVRARADSLEPHTDEAGQPALETVAEWADDLMDLTDQVSRITDVVTAAPEERRRPMDLVPVLEARLDAFEREHDVALTRSLPASAPAYANDLVGTVVDSLLENAVTHTDAVRPAVDVSARTTDDHVQVRIADDGPGIDDDLKESVFERDVGTGQTASGFGLYFVSVMMDFYGGDVWMEDLSAPIAAGTSDAAFEYRDPANGDGGHSADPDGEARPAASDGGEDGPHDAGDSGTAAGGTDQNWGTVAVLQFERPER